MTNRGGMGMLAFVAAIVAACSGGARSSPLGPAFVLDVPVSPYDVSAVALDDGVRTPLQVAQTGSDPAEAETAFAFEAEESFSGCGSASSGTGVTRGFLDIILP